MEYSQQKIRIVIGYIFLHKEFHLICLSWEYCCILQLHVKRKIAILKNGFFFDEVEFLNTFYRT